MSALPLPRLERFPSPYLPIYAAVGLAAGVALGEQLVTRGVFVCASERLTPNPLLLLAPLPFLVGSMALGWNRRRIVIPLLLLSLALLGAWRYTARPFEPCLGPGDLAFYNRDNPYGRPAMMEGVIIGYPEQRESYHQYRVRVDAYWQGQEKHDVTGVALVRGDKDTLYAYGDRLRIRGVPAEPPLFSGFDYRRYLARKGIHTLVSRANLELTATGEGNPLLSALYGLRARASALLDALLPEPYAALANGMILGIESGIPRDLYAQFNLTGTSHVIVISGSNIALVSGILLAVFVRLTRRRKRLASTLAITGIVLYTLLVGADPAVTRAAIMGSVYVLAVAQERQSLALLSLFGAGLVMLLLNPLTLWDVGFQLSFTATLGLILHSRPLQRWWNARIGKRLPRLANNLLAEGLLVTLAAQITTLPLIVAYFGRLSLISFLANVLILSVQPVILVGGGLSIVAGLAWLPLARLIALAPHACLWWTVFIVQKAAVVPFASLEISAFGRLLAVLGFCLYSLGFLWWLLRQEMHADTLLPPTWRPQLQRGIALAGIIVLPVWVGATWREAQPDGRLHLHLLGREQAADFLLVTPNGNRILLTTARDAPAYPLPDLLATLPGHRCPDLILQTRATASPLPPDFCPLTPALAPGHSALQPGAVLTLDEDVTLSQLPASADADDSLLFLLRYRDFTALLPFENSQMTQTDLLADLPAPLSLLPAPFPGTGAWPQPDLLIHTRPQIVLVPQGVTYPPGVQSALATLPLAPIPNNAGVEITTDGGAFALTTHPYAQDVTES